MSNKILARHPKYKYFRFAASICGSNCNGLLLLRLQGSELQSGKHSTETKFSKHQQHRGQLVAGSTRLDAATCAPSTAPRHKQSVAPSGELASYRQQSVPQPAGAPTP